MKRSIHFLLLAAVCCAAVSCAKNDDGPISGLEGTRWQVTLTDGNPASNPSGNNPVLYHPWRDCDKDDTYTFKDGRLSIDWGANVCDGETSLIASLSNQPFTYDEEKKTIVIGAGVESVGLQVHELNGSRLKIGGLIPTAGGNTHLIFLFKKK